jgi:hypothetical protein
VLGVIGPAWLRCALDDCPHIYMITLKDYEPQIIGMMDTALPRFAAEHPSIRLTAIGLYCCPWTGTLLLSLNSRDSATKPPENCPDFEYVEYEQLSFEAWQEDYESDAPKVKVSSWRTITHNHSKGDEAFNKPFFKFLVGIAEEYFRDGRCPVRATWVGVQMLDSSLIKFWKM